MIVGLGSLTFTVASLPHDKILVKSSENIASLTKDE